MDHHHNPNCQPYGFDYCHTRTDARTKNPENDSITVESMRLAAKAFGQLVVLGFDVTVFTPAPYQRRSLQRPSMEPSSCGRLRT